MIVRRYPTDAAPMVYACIERQMAADLLLVIAHNCGPRGEEMAGGGDALPVSDRGREDVYDLVDVA